MVGAGAGRQRRMVMHTLLLVDDDPRVRTSLARALRDDGIDVHVADSAERALAMLGSIAPEVVLADVRMPGMTGLELLRILRERSPGLDVVLMTAYDDLPVVAEAMREGARDFLLKPLDLHHLRRVLARAWDDRTERTNKKAGARAARGPEEGDDTTREVGAPARLVGRDPRMVSIFKVIGQVAASRTGVLIRGESGTGKELIARALHTASPWAAEPFVPVNCTAIPPGLLESELFGHVKGAFTGATNDRRGRFAQAGRGTIFLDEIGDTTPEFQGKLLRVLQEHEYQRVGAESVETSEARVIAATHRDLEELVAAGEFRHDLYYRLRVVEVRVPPLRERLADVPLLAEHLVRKGAAAAGRDPPLLSREAVDQLMAHAWPGNVRELENCLTRAAVLATGGVIRPEHLVLDDGPGWEREMRPRSLSEVEREHVALTLQSTGGNKRAAAKVLKISRPRLDRLIKKYGLDRRSEDA